MTSNAHASAPLKVGILLFSEGTQLLDVAPIDLLGMLDPSWLSFGGLPEEIIAQAPRFEYHFINEKGEGPNPMTGGFRLAITDSIHTCPPLDILLVGGPPPTYTPSPAICTFLRAQHSHVSAFLTICTGFLAPLHAGLLHNVRSTAPRGLLENLKKEHKDVKWEEKRWVRDGKMWSSGAIMNGFEMMGEFMRERWGGVGGEKEGKGEGALVGFVKEMSDFPRRGVDY